MSGRIFSLLACAAAAIGLGGLAPSPAPSSGVIHFATSIPRTTLGAGAPITDAALSGDGKTLALSTGDTIVLRDLSSGRTIAMLHGNVLPKVLGDHSNVFGALAISRDGAYVAAGGYNIDGFSDHAGVVDSVTRVWRRTNPQAVRVWKNVAPKVMAFSADDKELVVRGPALSDTPDTVWTANLGTGAMGHWIAEWKVDADKDSYNECSPAGFDAAQPTFIESLAALVLSSGECKTFPEASQLPLRLWPIGARVPEAPLRGPLINSYDMVALTPDAKTAVTAGDDRFAVWDLTARKLRVDGAGVANDISPRLDSIAASGRYAVGLYLADPSEQGRWDQYFLSVWDLRTARHIATTGIRTSSEDSHLLLSGDGWRAYVTTPSGIDEWDLKAGA
jgi:WD40 repeat protein